MPVIRDERRHEDVSRLTWVDPVSNARVLVCNGYVDDCLQSVNVQMSDDAQFAMPTVVGIVVKKENRAGILFNSNRSASAYLRELREKNGDGEVWFVRSFFSCGRYPRHAIRFISLVDEIIAANGGGYRIVVDNSMIEHHGEEVVGAFTSKVMKRRMQRGDLKERDVHYFPMQRGYESPVWVYSVSQSTANQRLAFF